MPFLNPEKSKWIIAGKKNTLELPVIEDVSMEELLWFRNKQKEIEQLKKDGNSSALLNVDEEWWEHVCTIGLGTTSEKIFKTGISAPKFRELMAEVYSFLTLWSTVEEAKLSGYYDQKTETKD